MRCGKGFLKCSLILFVNVNHTLHHLSHWLIFFQNGCGRKIFLLFVCLAAESQHNLQKVWSTLKLEELSLFIRVADLKAIKLTTGIGTHDSCVVFQPLDEFVACMRLLDVH